MIKPKKVSPNDLIANLKEALEIISVTVETMRQDIHFLAEAVKEAPKETEGEV